MDVMVEGSEAAPTAHPQAEAAQQPARRRRRLAVMVAVAASLALLVLTGTYALLSAGPERTRRVSAPGNASPSAMGPTAPAPSALGPSAAPGAPKAPAPGGRISYDQIKKATIAVPAWAADSLYPRCFSGQVTFANGDKGIIDGASMWLAPPVYADVDGDGAEETLVLLNCGTDTTDSQQVLALDRDAAGNIVTLAPVAVQTGAVKKICAVRPSSDGSVDVQVADFALTPGDGCTPAQTPYAIFQWRTYRLAGGAFQQTGGPANFPANQKVSDLTASASDLNLTYSGSRSIWTGTMTVTVRNAGHATLPSRVTISLVQGMTVTGPAGCTVTSYPQPVIDVVCPVAALAPGASRTLTLTITNSAPTAPFFVPQAYVDAADGYADLDGSNNTADFKIIYK